MNNLHDPQAKIECSACGWRHTVPCGREDCPHDAATYYHHIATALDNAVANGCLEELSKMSDEDIAYDLARHDSYCERIDIPMLVAGVFAWRNPQETREIPCDGGCHHWPYGAVDGDTCNCGYWYRFTGRIEASR